MVDVLFRAVALGLYSRWNEEDAWNSLQWAFDDSYVLMGVISYLYGNSIQRRQSEPDNFPAPPAPPLGFNACMPKWTQGRRELNDAASN